MLCYICASGGFVTGEVGMQRDLERKTRRTRLDVVPRLDSHGPGLRSAAGLGRRNVTRPTPFALPRRHALNLDSP